MPDAPATIMDLIAATISIFESASQVATNSYAASLWHIIVITFFCAKAPLRTHAMSPAKITADRGSRQPSVNSTRSGYTTNPLT